MHKNKRRNFLTKLLFKTRLARTEKEATTISIGIMVLLLALCVYSFFVNLNSEPIDERYYFNPDGIVTDE